ncbi:MAG: family 1 glycosylhydrolase, partial [Verrucomicrobiae bacterium]|nr:family 1 glycosylhydrolase [Verrucomicrobiae bacterium]
GAWNEDGKGPSLWDVYGHTPGKIKDGSNADVACDQYHLYAQDVALMKQLGFNAYRFSLSWPRILPEGKGAVNQKGLDYYRRLVDCLRENGIEPVATLYHWDLPDALHQAGGLLNRKIVDWFEDYTRIAVKALGDRVQYWIPVNEPNVHTELGYCHGWHAPGAVGGRSTSLQANHHLMLFHGAASRVVHECVRNPMVGTGVNVAAFYTAPGTPDAERLLQRIDEDQTWWYLDPAFKGGYPEEALKLAYDNGDDFFRKPGDDDLMKAPTEFIGFNHYFSIWAEPRDSYQGWNYGTAPAEIERCDNAWKVPYHPSGFYDCFKKLADRYPGLPMIVTENGLMNDATVGADGQCHDPQRVRYLKDFIGAMRRAVAGGIDVRGYLLWSFMDNFEWADGYASRFGIVHTDFTTLKRTVKDSGRYYATVARSNGAEL